MDDRYMFEVKKIGSMWGYRATGAAEDVFSKMRLKSIGLLLIGISAVILALTLLALGIGWLFLVLFAFVL